MQKWVRTSVVVLLAAGALLAVLRFGSSRRSVILVPAAQAEVDSESNGDGNSVALADELSTSRDKKGLGPAAPPSKHDTLRGQRNVLAEESTPGKSLNNEPPNELRPPLQRTHNERQEAVVDMFRHAWMGYTKYAWGMDILNPLTPTGSNTYGMGLTLVDSLDTMWLMGLTEEFQRARDWVASSLNFSVNHSDVSVFETTIRVLGGLLAAYHLTNDRMFLQKAVELGDRLLPAFRTPTGIPYHSIILTKGHPRDPPTFACVAELGSLQLEFRDLSRATGDGKYQEAVDKALDVFQSHLGDNIAPQEVSIETGVPKHTQLTVGSRTDSYYEYLLKQWIQSGKREEKFRGWYNKAANDILTKFLKYSEPSHMAFLARLYNANGHFKPNMDHLACFVPGMLALGYLHGFPEAHLEVARNLTHTCYELYHQSPSGLSPDEVTFLTTKNSRVDFVPTDSANEQRPETVESLFVLYRVTRDPLYRDWGWEILQAFDRHSRVDSGGFVALQQVNRKYPRRIDRMESFFLSETLKYLFLLFSDDADIFPLDEWVFNTEAHPLPVWTS